MATENHRFRERGKALKELRAVRSKAEHTFVIHYSCESFYDIKDGRTPRVTSIAVRNLQSAQTNSFSIHKVAEQLGFALDAIPAHYDRLEKQMLGEYFAFIQKRQGHTFVHWNMRDINFGFPALENRFRVLKGEPYTIADDKKFDLARALFAIYGRRYIGHGESGRFLEICQYNEVTDKDALTGKQEADAFQNQEYVRLHQSTLRKVDMIANVFERAGDGSLRTKAKLQDIYGLHPKNLVEVLRGHWIWGLVTILAVVLGIAKVVSAMAS